MTDLVSRIDAYLDDMPSDGGHSDAAGANCWELLREAAEDLRSHAQDADGWAKSTAYDPAILKAFDIAFLEHGVVTREQRGKVLFDLCRAIAALRTPAEGERQRDYDHGYGVGYEHGIKESEKEIEKWHRIAMEAGAITCVGGRHIYPLKDEVKQLRAQVEDAKDIIAGLFNFDMGSADRALKFLDDGLPTHDDVRGILSDTSTMREGGNV